MKTIKAFGDDFFPPQALPIRVVSIYGDKSPQHPGDLTGVEHFHDFNELVIVKAGYGVHHIDKLQYPVSGGDIFLIQGQIKHYFSEHRNLSLVNIMYHERRLKECLKGLQTLPGYQAMFRLEPAFRRQHRFKSRLSLARRQLAEVDIITRRMLDEQQHGQVGFDTMLLSMLLELMTMLAREYSKVQLPQAKSLYRIGSTIAELESNYRQKWTLEQIARIAGMSKSSVYTAFRNATGCSPVDFLIRIRLQNAAELLRQSSLDLNNIAFRCGFEDSNYFSRQFTKVYGTSPRSYRKKRIT